ncbi:MAG: tRNA preQ1(34) S-adenosylmethionine ribosyltransferase-isomerase QueA [Erysipelotrichaceae bacterium]|jgi:S-adenosylmethionine:tRNA ribosyltransferase-isomerase|nr:tRNA preQ1(34) S-adenosylmethionine ribosyltransferase-isomerase QueA [Erysipelotrichaceae bacterium]
MDIECFNYHLPEKLIAQTPPEQREMSRLLVLNKTTGEIKDQTFFNILDYLTPNDVLVRNNTRVIPARLYGMKKVTNGKVEVLLLKDLTNNRYECLLGNARIVKQGTEIIFSIKLSAICREVLSEGRRILEFFYEGIFLERLEEIGEMPLPPYIKTKLLNQERYQTVYAKVPGSAAAPTAGFHFSEALLKAIEAKGITIVDITLEVGLGTFKPVKAQDTTAHIMHHETYSINEAAAEALNAAKRDHKRIIAIGTTSVRTLEANYQEFNMFKAGNYETGIFITPGYRFQAVDAMITNFHLPKTTLLMLVSAFASRELILKSYQHAIKQEYRFFSFGDAMFIY